MISFSVTSLMFQSTQALKVIGHFKFSHTFKSFNISASSLWEFISRILRLGLASVRMGGKYLTHVSGKALPATREKFREKVTEVAESLGRDIDVQFTEAFVPSFMEVWVFSQITLKS